MVISFQSEISTYGRFRGLILRSQLIVLLQNKIFNEYAETWDKSLDIKIFRKEYPRYPTIEQVALTDEEKTYMIDLRHFMNPAPYTLQHVSNFLHRDILCHTDVCEMFHFFIAVRNTAKSV